MKTQILSKEQFESPANQNRDNAIVGYQAVPQRKERPRCHNCKFAGDSFKINTVTHMHCEHPKYKPEDFETGKLSAWDTLCEFWNTCDDHEFKSISESKK